MTRQYTASDRICMQYSQSELDDLMEQEPFRNLLDEADAEEMSSDRALLELLRLDEKTGGEKHKVLGMELDMPLGMYQLGLPSDIDFRGFIEFILELHKKEGFSIAVRDDNTDTAWDILCFKDIQGRVFMTDLARRFMTEYMLLGVELDDDSFFSVGVDRGFDCWTDHIGCENEYYSALAIKKEKSKKTDRHDSPIEVNQKSFEEMAKDNNIRMSEEHYLKWSFWFMLCGVKGFDNIDFDKGTFTTMWNGYTHPIPEISDAEAALFFRQRLRNLRNEDGFSEELADKEQAEWESIQ